MIHTVTVTGADNSVQPITLVSLQKMYPFVEWGVLLSRSKWIEGEPRYPTIEWLRNLKQYQNDLRLAGHICGGFIRDLLAGKDIFADELKEFIELFDRFQLNFHGIPTSDNSAIELAMVLKKYPDKEFIFQYDQVNDSLLVASKKAGVKVSALFDVSHGTGVLPSSWSAPLKEVNCGYAGGLGPENLFEQIKSIEATAGNISYWIDMETKVRSDNDKLFDMQKVSECLRIASGFVSESKPVNSI